MSKKTKIVVILLLVFVTGILAYNYVMTSGARDLEHEKSEFVVSAVEIHGDFLANSELATKKYLNKAVAITGKVTRQDKDVITLDGSVSCQLEVLSTVALNSNVTIKGRVTGYDDLLEEVKLDQCLIVQ